MYMYLPWIVMVRVRDIQTPKASYDKKMWRKTFHITQFLFHLKQPPLIFEHLLPADHSVVYSVSVI